MTTRGRLRLYGCGGAGVNIVSYFDRADVELSASIGAEIHATYIDTSRSNIKAQINEEHVSILDNVDGSGKIRSENANLIAENIRQILLKHKPMDMNVVVFSAAGGSGSVAGPLVIKALLEEELPVVALVITSTESVITTQNSIKTLKTLEAISSQTKKPVVTWLSHNQTASRSANDTDARAMISFMAIACSKQIDEVDSRDIANWLQFDRTTTTKPCLAGLTAVLSSEAQDWEGLNPLSILSIYPNPDAETISQVPEYQSTGYADLSDHRIPVLHLAVDVHKPRELAAQLVAIQTHQLKERDSRVQPKSIVDQGDHVDDNGLIL